MHPLTGGRTMDLQTGQTAPDFTLRATGNQSVHLAELLEQTVVLFFYPKDDTPG